MDTYKHLNQIVEANKKINHHFFDASSMRFFDSKILEHVYRNCYFITSEQFDYKSERLYTVRMCVNGSIETVGKFQQFTTVTGAEIFIHELPEHLPEAYKLASDQFNGRIRQTDTYIVTEALKNEPAPSLSFTCQWLLKNCEELDWAFIKTFDEKYKDALSKP